MRLNLSFEEFREGGRRDPVESIRPRADEEGVETGGAKFANSAACGCRIR